MLAFLFVMAGGGTVAQAQDSPADKVALRKAQDIKRMHKADSVYENRSSREKITKARLKEHERALKIAQDDYDRSKREYKEARKAAKEAKKSISLEKKAVKARDKAEQQSYKSLE